MLFRFAVVSETSDNSSHAPFFFSCRFTLAIIGFFIFMHLYAQRIGMSVAVVCMVNQTALDELEPLQTVNATQFSQHNATEWSLNMTVHSSAQSKCSHRLDDGTGVQKVYICFFWEGEGRGRLRNGDDAGNTIEESSSIFSLIQINYRKNSNTVHTFV